jgi:hypothetical protein
MKALSLKARDQIYFFTFDSFMTSWFGSRSKGAISMRVHNPYGSGSETLTAAQAPGSGSGRAETMRIRIRNTDISVDEQTRVLVKLASADLSSTPAYSVGRQSINSS